MNNFVDFWESLGYNKFFIVLFLVLFLSHVIVLLYRSRLLMSRKKRDSPNHHEGVSIIITCSNRAELLQRNLEFFLTQDYDCYEVIVVDECSEDDTQEILSEFQKKYPHLKTSRIFPETKFRRTKKLAINIGVLAAQYDILLFSEINCVPRSKNWVRAMQSQFDANTAVVIGYANYAMQKKCLSMRRYFRFLWFWKTLLLVKNKMFAVGNGCNMGYRKKYYLEKRGFSRNTQEYIGYDTEMVKELSRKGEVKVIKDEDARMLIDEDGLKYWKDDYSYYYATKRRWPWGMRICSNMDFILEFFVDVLCFYFLFCPIISKYVVILAILTFLIDLCLINLCLRHLGEKKLFLTSLTVNTFGFIYKLYYNFYSIFSSKKWR